MAISRLEVQCDAAIQLLNASPPRRSQIDLRNIMLLRGASSDRVEDETFISSILSTADQQLKPIRCPSCPSHSPCASHNFTMKQYGWFIPSEFNRDGDFYRCPYCSRYNVPDASTDTSTLYYPSSKVRRLEELGNAMFAEYAQLYYGDRSVANCYFWEDTEKLVASVHPPLGIAVIVSNRRQKPRNAGADVDGSQPDAFDGAAWNSTHIVSATPLHDGEYAYSMVSSLYLDVEARQNAGGQQEDVQHGSARFGGFVSHASKTFSSRRGTMGIQGRPVQHISPVGHQIQKVENRLRDVVAEVYFKRMGHLISSAFEVPSEAPMKPQRMLTATLPEQPVPQQSQPPLTQQQHDDDAPTPGQQIAQEDMDRIVNEFKQRKTAAKDEADSSAQQHGTTQPTAEAPHHHHHHRHHRDSDHVDATTEPEQAAVEEPAKRKSKKSKRASRWEAAQDEDGNTYYFNTKTGETQWEVPEELAPEIEAAAAQLQPSPQSVSADTGDVLTVLDVLSSLSLSGATPEEYEHVLRKQLRVKNVQRLLALSDNENGADEVLTPLIPTFGDRRKIVKWIRKNQSLRE